MEQDRDPILELTADCPSPDIAAFIDGELSSEAELKLGSHFAACRVCSDELNLQKHFLNALNGSLSGEFDVPEDITKRIVTSAESSVSGLRRRSEWVSALAVCCALLLFVLFTLGASARGTFVSFFDIAGQFAAVVSFVSHLCYDFAFGIVIVLRAVGAQPAFSLVSAGVIAVLAIAVLYKFSQIRFSRKKIDQLESGSGF